MKEHCLIREFDRVKDCPMVHEWFLAHGQAPVPLELLPKLGIVVFGESSLRPMAAMWLYMDNSVGVCFLERAVTCPGLGVKEAGAAILRGIDYLKNAAADMDYGVMMLRTYPACARIAGRAGFVADDKPLVSMSLFTRPVNREAPCR